MGSSLPQLISLLMKIGQAVFLQDLKLARRQDGAAIQALPEQLPDGLLISLDAGHGLDCKTSMAGGSQVILETGDLPMLQKRKNLDCLSSVPSAIIS